MVRVIASSVRGPAHATEGLPCQDAWLAVPDDRAALAVVCDGLGSRPGSRAGARAATRAVRDAWRLWKRSPCGTAEDLVRLVEPSWRLRLRELAPDQASTTCIVYAEDEHGGAAHAQLGDGLLARRRGDSSVSVHPATDTEFGMTLALGTPHALADWSLERVAQIARGEILLLASDGVSEDLDLARLGDLAAWVVQELGPLRRPGAALVRELRAWPVPHHRDDKTLLVMWKP